jgi:hypothetical protein
MSTTSSASRDRKRTTPSPGRQGNEDGGWKVEMIVRNRRKCVSSP